jgi:kynurenine formamidase
MTGLSDYEARTTWGSEDEVGAANRLGPSEVLAAISHVSNGRVYDLSFPLSMESPRHPIYLSPYFICLNHIPWASAKYEMENMGTRNGLAWAQERVELDMHTGTHVDGLGHVTTNGRTYNNYALEDVYGNWGLLKLGIENLPPLITRGVLLDVAGFLKRDMERGEVITLATLQETLAWEGVGIRAGDIVLLRTGWARHWGVDNATYMDGCPGIGIESARWLADQGVVAVGADQQAVDVLPEEIQGEAFPVHQHLLGVRGVYLIEPANLNEIAADQVYEFLTLCLTPKFVGATGAPVRLLAVT